MERQKLIDGISVQIEGTGKKISIPYLLYAQDYCRPFDENERNEKIAEQTISFAKSLGLKEGDYVLCGSESTISHVIEVILKKMQKRKFSLKNITKMLRYSENLTCGSR